MSEARANSLGTGDKTDSAYSGEYVASQAHVLGQKLFALVARNLNIYLGVCLQLFKKQSQSWLKHSSSTFPV